MKPLVTLLELRDEMERMPSEIESMLSRLDDDDWFFNSNPIPMYNLDGLDVLHYDESITSIVGSWPRTSVRSSV